MHTGWLAAHTGCYLLKFTWWSGICLSCSPCPAFITISQELPLTTWNWIDKQSLRIGRAGPIVINFTSSKSRYPLSLHADTMSQWSRKVSYVSLNLVSLPQSLYAMIGRFCLYRKGAWLCLSSIVTTLYRMRGLRKIRAFFPLESTYWEFRNSYHWSRDSWRGILELYNAHNDSRSVKQSKNGLLWKLLRWLSNLTHLKGVVTHQCVPALSNCTVTSSR